MSSGDCFLKIVATKAGVIKGETDDPEFTNYIPVKSWSWGVQAPVQGSQRTGKAQGRQFECSFPIDTSYTALTSALVTNDLLKKVTLEMRRAGGEFSGKKAQNFLSVNLTKATLVSVQISHSQADTELVPLVRVSMAFEEMEIEYRAQAKHGGASGGGSVFNWQISNQA